MTARSHREAVLYTDGRYERFGLHRIGFLRADASRELGYSTVWRGPTPLCGLQGIWKQANMGMLGLTEVRT